ncbi:hypothetical protein DPQ33_13125 [Oceanidesulfovibrio indonesiensis]|uniref:Ig-like domain-containing protein n=1 Tax=Oceanidesulfovibrio indonesiensis TaxID=54767 RepID=A0A7M3MDF7_9BACT|nr:tetratricopeptide repeat protein [Oceanidesulfovibrio indonesiensis]TVM16256.1 hypothetical protein DPQ33_13125 [Oceanidesulfovibrio indonesiensis]
MRHVKIACLLFLILLLVSWYLKTGLPAPSAIDPRLLAEPVQERLEMQPFTVRGEHVDYTITPLYSYDLHGLVVSCHDTDGMFDYYHDVWGDTLNVKDLCVVWGSNVESDIYTKLSYSSGSYTCYVSSSDSATWSAFEQSRLSNNHLLTDDPRIASALRNTDVGDQVRIRGYLAQYSHDQGFERGTSTTRTDTGDGACETIFVTDYDVLARFGGPWRTIHSASIVGFLGTLLLLAGWFVYRLFAPESLNDVERFVDKATRCAEHGDLNGALRMLAKAIERNPYRPDIFNARAAVHEALGDPDAADNDRRRASDLGGEQPFVTPAAVQERDVSRSRAHAGYRPPWLDEDGH